VTGEKASHTATFSMSNIYIYNTRGIIS